MHKVLQRTMALALHKVAGSFSAGQCRVAASPSILRSTVSTTPILRPWWRSISSSLTASAPGGGFLFASSRQLRAQAATEVASEGLPEAVEVVEEAEGGETEEPSAGEGEAEVEEDENQRPRVKTKALTKQVKHIMNLLNVEALANANKDKNIPDIRTGDILAMRVEVPENKRRISLVRGIVIAKNNAGINSTFRIRRVLAGVGVEMVFPLYSPNIKEIKVVDKRKVRRAKLYYLRDKIARLSTIN